MWGLNRLALLKREVLEEGTDSGETKVTAANVIVALCLNVMQESADEGGIEILQRQSRGRFL